LIKSKVLCLAGKNEIAAECLVYSVAQLGIENIFFLPSVSNGFPGHWQTNALDIAEALTVKVLSNIENLYEIHNLIFISLEYDRIITIDKFASKHLYNLHFSSLPKYRGVYTSFLPIRDREESTGVTLHKIDKGVDTGPIIDQVNFRIPHRTRGNELYLLYTRYGVELFKKNLEALINGEVFPIEQDHLNATSFSRNEIDLKTTDLFFDDYSQNIIARFLGLTFPIFQRPTFNGHIVQSLEMCSSHNLQVGQTQYISDKAFRVGTKDSDLLLILD
jgi:methionyl-tRNA formyltransferase